MSSELTWRKITRDERSEQAVGQGDVSGVEDRGSGDRWDGMGREGGGARTLRKVPEVACPGHWMTPSIKVTNSTVQETELHQRT